MCRPAHSCTQITSIYFYLSVNLSNVCRLIRVCHNQNACACACDAHGDHLTAICMSVARTLYRRCGTASHGHMAAICVCATVSVLLMILIQCACTRASARSRALMMIAFCIAIILCNASFHARRHSYLSICVCVCESVIFPRRVIFH